MRAGPANVERTAVLEHQDEGLAAGGGGLEHLCWMPGNSSVARDAFSLLMLADSPITAITDVGVRHGGLDLCHPVGGLFRSGGRNDFCAPDLVNQSKKHLGGRRPCHKRDLRIGQALLESREHGDGMAFASAAEQAFDGPAAFDIAGGVGQRADHRDLFSGFGQGQSLILILQQHHGARGELAFQFQALGAIEHGLDLRLIDVGMIEQADFVLKRQDGENGLVDFGLGNLAVLHQLGKVAGIGLAGHVHVDAGAGCLCTRHRRSRRRSRGSPG